MPQGQRHRRPDRGWRDLPGLVVHAEKYGPVPEAREDAMVQTAEHFLAESIAETWVSAAAQIGRGQREDVMRCATKYIRVRNEIDRPHPHNPRKQRKNRSAAGSGASFSRVSGGVDGPRGKPSLTYVQCSSTGRIHKYTTLRTPRTRENTLTVAGSPRSNCWIGKQGDSGKAKSLARLHCLSLG